MFIVETGSTKPQYNLALEEYLCHKSKNGGEFFMLWQNEPTIVIGRFQNTLAQINAPYVKERGIHVVRRNSGGGAVYHDLGNINYSFITPGDSTDFNFDMLAAPMVGVLRRLGIDAECSGRNDITVGGRKISGGAQFRSGGVILHHGTLLFNSDLDVLSEALQVSRDKFKDKGVKSIRSRICNILPLLPRAIGVGDFMSELRQGIESTRHLTPMTLEHKDLENAKILAEKKYSAWEWCYGKSPEFTEFKTARFSWGSIEAHISVENGTIKNCLFFGDFFGNGDFQPIVLRLRECPYNGAAITEALRGANTDKIFAGSELSDILTLLCPEL